jgi:molybdate transport system ATP-binding protein
MTGPTRSSARTAVLDVHVRRHVVDARMTLPLRGDAVTVLFGPSGSGKTTVLRCIAGLDRTVGGHVVVDGVTWDDGHRVRVPARDRKVGYLFQEHALFPHLGVEANVAYGLQAVPRHERAGRVREALRTAHALSCVGRSVAELSGGEAQRVALARAIAARPRLLVLDEPLSALDAPTRTRLRSELREMLTTAGVPAVIVTHDRAEALALADQVVVMVEGRVRQVGTPQEVFDQPADAEVARVVGIETATAGVVRSVESEQVEVTVGRLVVTALVLDRPHEPYHPGDEVLVCIRAEDVALELPDAHPAARSPRNRLAGTVTRISVDGALVRVGLDVGFPLTAYVTRSALDELALRTGSAVVASVKSPAVHLINRGARRS